MTWVQRQELSPILHWTRQPVTAPEEYLLQVAVRCFLNGVDPQALLEARGYPTFVARRAAEKGRVWLGNERAKRRMRGAEILESRKPKSNPKFTSENFRVTMDHSQDRNYGMVNISIYCIIEVWEDDDVDKEYLVNFSDFKTKEWLTRLLVWGLMNSREILIKPASEVEMSSMKMFIPKDKDRAA